MCPLLFVFVTEMGISELRCSRRFQSGAKCEAIKVTRPSYFGTLPSYFEALWYLHLYFDHKSNI